ncbi:MAG: ATP-binding protein [Cyclobacteriaceae bacterium]|nr:ATP-binding protein [Cyclobacteriaceae bacterium]
MNYSCKVPCEKEKLREIRAFISDALASHGLDELQISSLVLAIDEVCANLIIHGRQCSVHDTIQIDIEIPNKKGILFKIFDYGSDFDINDYKEPKIEELIKSRRKGGVGLILVKKIMDKIQFINENGRKVCHLYKKTDLK